MRLLSRCDVPSRSQVYLLSFFIFHSCERDGEKILKRFQSRRELRDSPRVIITSERRSSSKGFFWLIARPSNISRFWGRSKGTIEKGSHIFIPLNICLLRCNEAWIVLKIEIYICNYPSKRVVLFVRSILQAHGIRPLILSGGKKENQINHLTG